jgi:hypothetical protein
LSPCRKKPKPAKLCLSIVFHGHLAASYPAAVVGDAGSLEIDLQRSVERKLKGLKRLSVSGQIGNAGYNVFR